ncbi:MAG: hypothetical protein ACOC1K_01600 [Nanoarchaeota archaeon]
MKSCNCTLPYTNPDACKNCSQRDYDELTLPYNYNIPYTQPSYIPYTQPSYPQTPISKKVRTVEKYDNDGKLISKEVITEEEYLPESGKPIWKTNEWEITCKSDTGFGTSTGINGYVN